MHEMSYIVRLVNLAAKTAEDQKASSVEKIVVSVGKMTGIESYYMQKYYKTAIKNTILDGSELEIEMIDVKAVCENCQKEYIPDAKHDYLCPNCGSGHCRIIDGRSVTLEKVILKKETEK